jgi:hypothetical protein
MFLGPKAENADAWFEIDTKELAFRENADTWLFIWLRAEYNDIFEKTRLHFTEHCFRVTLTKIPATISSMGGGWHVSLSHYGPYNRSDEDN